MSTQVLYHGFGIQGYRHVSMKNAGGHLHFTIMRPRERLRCRLCGSDRVHSRGRIERRFRSVPIGSKPVTLHLGVPRVECLDCGKTRQAKIGFADEQRSYTRSFERYALDLCKHMTIQDVAVHLQVSWGTIKEIQKRDLQKHYGKPKLKGLTQIAIDEISIGKRHRYLTVVLNLVSGAVVFVGEGKGADALEPFWKRLRRSGARVEAVAIDMSAAYWSAVRDNIPNAAIVFDHFHVMKLFNEKLSDLRRDLYREATEMMHKDVLKGTRWLLLMNYENLDESKNERTRLEEAIRLNAPLATAYYMKEELRELWELDAYEEAEKFLMDWILRAESSGIAMLKKFAKTLRIHALGILAYYDYPISTGPLEGTNNKIKTMKRQAYGFRDQEFFKLKIYAIHKTKYALVG